MFKLKAEKQFLKINVSLASREIFSECIVGCLIEVWPSLFLAGEGAAGSSKRIQHTLL